MNPIDLASNQSGDSVRFRISHRTVYTYSENVAVCHNQIRMQPGTNGNLVCEQSNVTILPEPTSRDEHIDYFGNRVVTFSIEHLHQALEICAESTVALVPRNLQAPVSSPNWESFLPGAGPILLRCDEHRCRSSRIRPAGTFADYAASSFLAGRPIVEASLDLAKRVHDEFEYDTSATDVDTPTESAFELRRGVCQDFAHVQIACLRSLGLPARYVSGYVRTIPPPGKERLIGADESHAWLEVYAGPELQWVGVDPTNACLAGRDHIPTSVGRDYDDVSPMRGVVLGGGANTLKVSVDVEPIE